MLSLVLLLLSFQQNQSVHGYNLPKVIWQFWDKEELPPMIQTIKENNLTDTVLYRTFSKDPLKFWLWRSYFTHERYKYPYIDLKD